MEEQAEQPLSALEALDVLDRFLDVSQDLLDRFEALNDCRVPDSLVAAFLAALEPEMRLKALGLCERPNVLGSWAAAGNVDERCCVAANEVAGTATLRKLASDGAEEVRRQIPLNLSADLDTIAWLMADPSQGVQEALRVRFWALLHDLDAGEDDELPGEEPSLSFLHEMVPATEEEDCLEEWEEARHRECGEQSLKEIHRQDEGRPEFDSNEADLCEDEIEPWSLTHAQVLGLLSHQLGARET